MGCTTLAATGYAGATAGDAARRHQPSWGYGRPLWRPEKQLGNLPVDGALTHARANAARTPAFAESAPDFAVCACVLNVYVSLLICCNSDLYGVDT
jgi:hypothetical protein